jgi:hypothetical protein
MKKIIMAVLFLIILTAAVILVLNTKNKNEKGGTEYVSITYPNGPTFQYRSDLYFDNNYDIDKTFVFRSSENYAIVSTIENYSENLYPKASTGKITNENGSIEYKGVRGFGKHQLTEFEDCGPDTCQTIFILKGPKDQALVIEGDINFINPNSVVFN